MSILAHLLRPAVGARRAYSAFSKPGGGGYFNSSKSPKVAPPSSKTKVDSSSTTNADTTAASAVATKDEAAGVPANTEVSQHAPSPPSVAYASPFSPTHPRISSQDLKLHQFFSLHRPLLTISQSPSSIFDSYLSPFPNASTASPPPPAAFGSVEETYEATPEADADAARQLARAMVINRIGASLAWEDTLKRLGLDVTLGRAEEVSLAEAEFEIYMDSTKRKRRKKMKKHKLKKRRRLNRSQRMKIGR